MIKYVILNVGKLASLQILTLTQHMLTLRKGSHGSTYGGNPLGMRLAFEALNIIEDEKLAENAGKMEMVVKDELQHLPKGIVSEYRSKGLMAAVILKGLWLDVLSKGWNINVDECP